MYIFIFEVHVVFLSLVFHIVLVPNKRFTFKKVSAVLGGFIGPS